MNKKALIASIATRSKDARSPQGVARGTFIAGCLLLAAYLIFSLFVGSRSLNNFDYQSTVFLQSIINPVLNTPLSFLSLIGSFEISSLILFFILLNLARHNLLNLSTQSKFLLHFSKEKLKSIIAENRAIVIIAFFYVAILGFELIGKNAIYHPNPPRKFFRYSIPFNFPSSHVSTNYSYPSGHAARTAFISIIAISFILIQTSRSNLAPQRHPERALTSRRIFLIFIILLFDILMFISRPYLGEHWSTDVIGGFLLGASMAFFPISFSPQNKKRMQSLAST